MRTLKLAVLLAVLAGMGSAAMAQVSGMPLIFPRMTPGMQTDKMGVESTLPVDLSDEAALPAKQRTSQVTVDIMKDLKAYRAIATSS